MTDSAVLCLEDGTAFLGRTFGSPQETFGEVVFNTSMTGYQEVLTDPSYAGQIVVMTHPQIGNYGTNSEDSESRRPFVRGFVVRECSPIFSNWRGQSTLSDYLGQNSIGGISDLDTRSLVRHIRRRGAMRGAISSRDLDPEALQRRVLQQPPMAGSDFVREVTTDSFYHWPAEAPEFHVVALDYGIKTNILRCLAKRGCRVTVMPARSSPEDILSLAPDGVFLSNGPGDPEPLDYAVDSIRKLLNRVPLFGICLGHQLLARALGGRTFKMKFGHRGANQPVKNLITGKIEITSHNHGFAVDPESLDDRQVQTTHVNLNDQTLEGLRHRYLPIFSVQYHPEASPGPRDSLYLFDEFIQLMNQDR